MVGRLFIHYIKCCSVARLCCLRTSMLSYRRKSRSISPRHHKSRSPTPRRRKSRSPTPKRYKRYRSRSSSLSPTRKSSSPSLGSIEHKTVIEKQKKEEEKKRYNSCLSFSSNSSFLHTHTFIFFL